MSHTAKTLLTAILISSLAVLSGCQDPEPKQKGDGWGVGADGGTPDVSRTCEHGESADGVCGPGEPQGTPTDACKSGAFAGGGAFDGDGVCLPGFNDWECPDGWNEKSAFRDANGQANSPEGIEPSTICVPPPAAEDCPVGEMPSLGKTGCVRQGLECPDGKWHDVNTLRSRAPGFSREIIYVDPAAGSGGDGTKEKPFASIQAAEEESEISDIIALAKGDYTEAIEVKKQVAVVGACVEETRLSSPAQAEGKATVEITGGGGAVVTDMTITGNRPGIWTWRTETASEIKGIRVDGAEFTGIIVAGTGVELKGSNIVVTGTKPQVKARRYGRGVLATGSAVLSLGNSVIEDNRDAGLVADLIDTKVTLQDVIIRNTKERDEENTVADTPEAGLKALAGANVSIGRALIDGNKRFGLYAKGNQTEVSAHVVQLSNSQAIRGAGGWGAQVGDKATLTIGETLITGHRDYGVVASGAASNVTLRDTLVEGMRGEENGLWVQRRANATVERTIFDGLSGRGVAVAGEAASAKVLDSVFRMTFAQDSPAGVPTGWGVDASRDGTAVVERTLFEQNPQAGLGSRDGGVIEATDIVVRGPRDAVDGVQARGINVEGGSATVQRGLIDDIPHYGVAGFRKADLTLTDLVVRGGGWGITIQEQADLKRLERSLVTGAEGVGLHVGSRGRASLIGSTIEGTRKSGGEFGDGVMARDNSAVDATASVVRQNARAGFLSSGSILKLSDVLVTDNPLGIVEAADSQVESMHTTIEASDEAQKSCDGDCLATPTGAKSLFGGSTN